MTFAPALIGAGASLLGGLFSGRSSRRAQERQNEYNDPLNQRNRLERAGFNPAAFMNPNGNIQAAPAASGQFGNAIANAGLFIASDMREEEALKIEKSRLQMDRQKLDKLLQQATIRPKSGGIYSGNIKSPSMGGVGAPATVAAPMLNGGSRERFGPPLQTIADPTGVMRDDGLPSANPDAPAEFEADIWERARKGEILPFGWELYKRNTMTDRQYQRWESLTGNLSNRTKKAGSNLKSVFSEPRKKNAKVPRISFPAYLPSISD